jgi:hypothetical protein
MSKLAAKKLAFLVLLAIVFGCSRTPTGCTKSQGSALDSILTSTGECVSPIVIQGLFSGQPAGAIVDMALTCLGSTVEAVLAYVESLEAPLDGGLDGGIAALSPDMQQRLGALHAELVNRVAAKKAAR